MPSVRIGIRGWENKIRGVGGELAYHCLILVINILKIFMCL